MIRVEVWILNLLGLWNLPTRIISMKIDEDWFESQPGKKVPVSQPVRRLKHAVPFLGRRPRKGNNTISSSLILASSKRSCLEIHSTLHLQVAADLGCPWVFTLDFPRIQNPKAGWFRQPFYEVLVSAGGWSEISTKHNPLVTEYVLTIQHWH